MKIQDTEIDPSEIEEYGIREEDGENTTVSLKLTGQREQNFHGVSPAAKTRLKQEYVQLVELVQKIQQEKLKKDSQLPTSEQNPNPETR